MHWNMGRFCVYVYESILCVFCALWVGKEGMGFKTAWGSRFFPHCFFDAPAVLDDICFVGSKHGRDQNRSGKEKGDFKKADKVEKKKHTHQEWKYLGKRNSFLSPVVQTSFVPSLDLFLFYFPSFSTSPSTSRANVCIPHCCDQWSNATEQSGIVKIGPVICQER